MKKNIIITKIIFLFLLNVCFGYAQTATLNADNIPNNTYELINSVLSPGYNGIEAPDVSPGNHTGDRHIAEVFDADLNKNVFEFYSHVASGPTGVLDNDMSTGKVDRQRVEIKTYNSSPLFLKGYLGETVTYSWRFKVPVGFQPSKNFTHIHQVKPVDGDDSHPIFAITLRKGTPNKLEVAYVKDYTVSSSPTKLAELELSLFEGKWVDVVEVIKVGTGTSGAYSIVIKNVLTNVTLFNYSNNAMQTIRSATTDPGSPQVANSFIRPKWGIYRSVLESTTVFKDESIRFSDFSISKGVSKFDQSITFGAISTKQLAQSDFSANATASSGLAVSLSSSNTTVATIVGGLIHIVGVGETTITASQAGDATYNAAPNMSQTLAVVAANNFVFRSLVTSANWNTASHWQNDSGNGTWTTSSVVPTAFNSVFIQSGHNVAVSGVDAHCKDLNISTSGIVSISTNSIVNVNGKIRAFAGSAVTTSNSDVYTVTSVDSGLGGSMISATGIIKFVGSSRIISNTGEWTGSGANFHSEIDLDSGAIGTFQTSMKFRSLLIKNGTISTNNILSLGSAVGNGNIIINNGAKLVSSRSVNQTIAYTSALKCGTVTVNGTLELTGVTPIIDCTTFTGSGTVILSGSSPNFVNKSYTDSANIDTYYNLILSGTGAKTFPSYNITVTNDLSISGSTSLVVPAGRSLTVNNNINNNSSATALVIESGANLNQGSTTTTNANTGAITIKRNSNPLFRGDYTLWSSPVSDQNLLAFSPQTISSRFYSYNSVSNLYNSVLPSSTDFATANGYLIRMPNTNATTNYDSGTATLVYPGVFTGVPNNGDVNLGGEEGLISNKYYAIGNPYPSTINANLFLNGNATGGTLYYWRKTNAIANSGSAYASYTIAGGTIASNIAPNNIEPNGTIQVGQGFIVQTAIASTSLNFTNSMRTINTNNQFFKTKNTDERSRIWLNLTNSSGVFSQMLLAYLTGATSNFDYGIDGKYIGDSPIALTSNINNEEYTIQGRGLPFDPADSVALNFKTNVDGNYTIGIDHVDGLFENNQDIYLVDAATGTETNLKLSNYTFDAKAGVDNSRFLLKYQKTLKVVANDFNENSVQVFKKEGKLHIDSGVTIMDQISIFDMQGKLICKQDKIDNSNATVSGLTHSKGVLVITIVSKDNTKVSIKVIY